MKNWKKKNVWKIKIIRRKLYVNKKFRRNQNKLIYKNKLFRLLKIYKNK